MKIESDAFKRQMGKRLIALNWAVDKVESEFDKPLSDALRREMGVILRSLNELKQETLAKLGVDWKA